MTTQPDEPLAAVPLPVPPDVAAELLRLVQPALIARVRADGAPLSGRTIAYLHALHRAAERPAAVPTAATGSEDPHPATVEVTVDQAAKLLECRPRWVRQLIADGRLKARRAGARLWLVDVDSLDAYRHGGTECPNHSQTSTPARTHA